MNPTDLAYAAGIVDGEGCVFFMERGSASLLFLKVNNTREQLCWWFKEHFGGCVSYRKPESIRHAPSWTWSVHGPKAATILHALFPFMVLKRPQALLAEIWNNWRPIHTRSMKTGQFLPSPWPTDVRRFIHEKSRALNRLGVCRPVRHPKWE